MPDIFLNYPPPFVVLRQSPIDMELTSLARLVISELWEFSCLCFPSTGVRSAL